jgi:hypothetical protein
LSLDEGELSSLQALPDQRVKVGVKNTGDEDLRDVHLSLEVSSENTALSNARYYRETVDSLTAGRAEAVRFNLDLSAPEGAVLVAPAAPEPPRTMLEVRATTPIGVSAVKTAVLPLRSAP